MSDDEAAVYEFCIQLHRTRKVDDATFNRALALLGEQGVVDLVGVSGYYPTFFRSYLAAMYSSGCWLHRAVQRSVRTIEAFSRGWHA
jgi:4-carboxymuconolactone decarboxylase